MHVFFSGIGGTGMSSLAQLAQQADYQVSGSDQADSAYTDYLKQHGIDGIVIGQSTEQIEKIHSNSPIDWFVYTSALPADSPELVFCQQHGIKTSKRDEFLNQFIKDKGLDLVAIAGTHGKSTTTAMVVWLFSQLKIPVSYSLGAKLNFAELGAYDPASKFFIYEADEFDRNFLNFYPSASLISGIDWDHPDIYPTRESYLEAFGEFVGQSDHTYLWQADVEQLGLEAEPQLTVLDPGVAEIDQQIKLIGRVNRENAWLACQAISQICDVPMDKLIAKINNFPGLGRRFEMLAPNIYSDYAHTPPKIRGALQTAQEITGDNIVVVYEGLHNTRQHFIKDELAHLFDDVKQLYIVPSYLAREDPNLKTLTSDDLIELLSSQSKAHAQSTALNEELLESIKGYAASGDLVLVLSAGGTGSLDEWLRAELTKT